MQSRAGIAIRSLVLLAVVLGMPLLAVPNVGERLSSRWQRIVQQLTARWTSPMTMSAKPRVVEAPVTFEPIAVEALPSRVAERPADVETADAETSLAEVRPAQTASSRDQQASTVASIERPIIRLPDPQGGEPVGGVAGQERPQELGRMEQRLRELGASYMLLKHLPEARAPYHFYCRVDVPGSRVYSRGFEAREADAAAAMRQVLARVERWVRSSESQERGTSDSPSTN